MEIIKLEKVNEVYNKVICEPGVGYEIKDYFTFKVPNYQFMPAYKNKLWDGNIYLFNPMNCLLYGGLTEQLEIFCKSRDYKLELLSDFSSDNMSVKETLDFVKSLNLPFQPREYQLEAFVRCVRSRRKMLLSPTGSGKSLIIYLLSRFYNLRTLIIVPTTSLIHQMTSDFLSYGYSDPDNIHKIYQGQDKNIKSQFVISTWQSIFKQSKDWFNQFDVVIGDEAHLFKAKSLTSIMTKLETCKYRFGFTGTLDGSETHQLVLEGLFGPVKKIITTSELIEQKHLSNFMIKCISLQYPDDIKKECSKYSFQQEMDFLVSNQERNKFITNLSLSLKGNTLLLFQYVDKHGKVLYDMISNEHSDKDIYFVHGGIDGNDREKIRNLVEKNNNSIIIASYGTFSTGINIKNLHNIIFSSPSKSKVRNLQSIGRGLRLSDNKEQAVLYDISDDLSWKERKNFTLLHYIERVKIYNEEQFEYKTYKININT